MTACFRSTSLALLALVLAAGPAAAQKQGGTLRVYHRDNPPSASILEEATVSVNMPFMPVFNNLVMFDPAKSHESADTIVPDMATSWSWDATNTKLTFKLHEGVKGMTASRSAPRRAVHLEHADRQGGGRGLPQEPAPDLVLQSRRGSRPMATMKSPST